MTIKQVVALGFTSLCAGQIAFGAPIAGAGMIRIAWQDVSANQSRPGMDAPGTNILYRMGDTIGRIEQSTDEEGVQPLIIYNHGDMWMINRYTDLGRYMRDSGPTYTFHAPMFPIKEFAEFEFGREKEFFGTHPKITNTVTYRKTVCQCLSTNAGIRTLKLYLHANTGKPAFVELSEHDTPICIYQYHSWESGLKPDPSIFQPPSNILILNAGLSFDPAPPPTQEQKMWALGTCAVVQEMNHCRHDVLGGRDLTPAAVQAERHSLARWWSVTNREDLLQTLQWVEFGGHREDFILMGRSLSNMSASDKLALMAQASGNPNLSNKVDMVSKYYDKLGDNKSLMGWDFGRYVGLCGWGYVCGYLTEEESWQRIMPVARLLQKTFSSWEDLGTNYLIGRQFWSLKQSQAKGDDAQEAYNRLCADPSSPWRKYSWKMDLQPPTSTNTPSGVPRKTGSGNLVHTVSPE